MIIRARKSFEAGEFLNEFIPVPKDLTETISGTFGDEDKQKELEIAQAYNLKNYGYTNWYDYCIAEWGTKWDVGGEDSDVDEVDANTITLTFDSAWSPPIQAYAKLEQQGFDVVAYYHEPGMAFCGCYTTESGDEYYEILECSGDWVKENIPEEIDDLFAISDLMYEWEAQEEQ